MQMNERTNQNEDRFLLQLQHKKDLEEALLDMLVLRNIETMEHIKYVQGYTKILAEEFAFLNPKSRMTKKKIERIVEAAQFHDIGKIVMSDVLIHGKEKLSKADREPLKAHTIEGSKLMKKVFRFCGEEYVKICSNICLYHHEKYDGSGYPKGLKNDRIPIEAQFVALADMYDVLINQDLKYEKVSKEKAYYMLMNGICGELSPKIKECLENTKEKLENFSLVV